MAYICKSGLAPIQAKEAHRSGEIGNDGVSSGTWFPQTGGNHKVINPEKPVLRIHRSSTQYAGPIEDSGAVNFFEKKLIGLLQFILIAAFLLLAPTAAFAQENAQHEPATGSVKGIVRGMIINEGVIYYTRLSGAEVSVETAKSSAVTSTDGRFRLLNVPTGKHTIVIKPVAGDTVKVPVNVRKGQIENIGYIPVFQGTNQPLPAIEPGSMIATFIEAEVPASKQVADKKSTKKTSGDTQRNRIAFYRPQSTCVYLEIAMSDFPTLLAVDSNGRYMVVTTRHTGVMIWDLRSTKLLGRLDIPGTPTDIRVDEVSPIFYVTTYGSQNSAVHCIDAPALKVVHTLQPNMDGMLVASLPTGMHDRTLNVVTNLNGGFVTLMDLHSKSILMKQEVGAFPVDIVRLPEMNRILVSNNQGKSVMLLDADTLSVTAEQALDGNPSRLAASTDGAKVYVSLSDRGQIWALDSRSGQVLGKINVGKNPFWLRTSGKHLYVCNRQDGTISVIDTTTDTVVRVTQPENFATMHSVDVVPQKSQISETGASDKDCE